LGFSSCCHRNPEEEGKREGVEERGIARVLEVAADP
jgi:hypothetical protein